LCAVRFRQVSFVKVVGNLCVFSSFFRTTPAPPWCPDCRFGSFLHSGLPEFRHVLQLKATLVTKPPQVYLKNAGQAARLRGT
jgi:hypothetical protein